MNFNFIEINDSTIQIYGLVNGFANKVYFIKKEDPLE